MRAWCVLALLTACTVQVPVPQPVITIECVDVYLSGAPVSTVCLDAGVHDAGKESR